METDKLPLEDSACDVIRKAMKGHGLDRCQLSSLTKLTEEAIQEALDGESNEATLKIIAVALKLSPQALAGLSCYAPDVALPKNLYRFTSAFGHAGVNAYLVVSEGKAIVFDTGTNAAPIVQFAHENNLVIEAVYITHRHRDHVGGVSNFPNTPIIFPEEINYGDLISFDSTGEDSEFKVLDVPGHLPVAKAFYYEGLETPICILGDCIFAGSMGKTADSTSYQLAIEKAVKNILTLPETTILCSGHGPLTTVHLEKQHNPFLNNCLTHSQ